MKKNNKFFIQENAIIKLLQEHVLFASSSQYYCDYDKELKPETLTLFVLCNDTFAHAADAEEITYDEVEGLYNLYKKYNHIGTTIWVCKKRNQKPMKSVIEWIKQNNKEAYQIIKNLPE